MILEISVFGRKPEPIKTIVIAIKITMLLSLFLFTSIAIKTPKQNTTIGKKYMSSKLPLDNAITNFTRLPVCIFEYIPPRKSKVYPSQKPPQKVNREAINISIQTSFLLLVSIFFLYCSTNKSIKKWMRMIWTTLKFRMKLNTQIERPVS